MQQYKKWNELQEANDRYDEEYDNFSIFYQENEAGKTFFEMLCDLAYGQLQLQICVEGILEDLENGQENQENRTQRQENEQRT